MITFGKVQFSRRLKAQRIATEDPPRVLFSKIKAERECSFLLESSRGGNRLAEYSFIGFDPSRVVRAKDGVLEVEDPVSGRTERAAVEDPLAEIKRLVPPDSVSGLFRFVGGAVGYVSYEAAKYWERLPEAQGSGSSPDLEFGIYEDGIVFDHARRDVYYYTLGEDRIEVVERALKERSPESVVVSSDPRPSMERSEFEQAVAAAKEYIAAGDVFQVVLSKKYEFEAEGSLDAFYSRLSETNPSPYMYYLKFGERSVVGSSPEMLARVEERRVETYPIAGTRPHHPDAAENERLTKELLSDPKENAEHVMLVDLARNDVGKVSKYGSVGVPEFKTVQQFSHVQHMVSKVTGDLRQDCDSYDALRALFPAGTVSGAPKVRAMEIINELEGARRGPYGGAVGYFSFNGNCDFAITIRTLVAEGKRCSIQSGAGIVADSVPEREWEETEAKAAGLLKAMETASGGRP